jgi:hypothetical protein
MSLPLLGRIALADLLGLARACRTTGTTGGSFVSIATRLPALVRSFEHEV